MRPWSVDTRCESRYSAFRFISDVSQARRETLNRTYKVKTTDDSSIAISGGDAVAGGEATEPEGRHCGTSEASSRRSNSVLVYRGREPRLDDLAAGSQASRHFSCHAQYAGPNSPGHNGGTATPEVGEQQRELARTILAAMGKEIYVAEEKYVDMATAVSGSGPAYIFLIIEALTDAAVHIGFPRSMAEQLVLETVIGSACAVQVTASTRLS